MEYEYIENPRDGDFTRFKIHYPTWEITKSLDEILLEIVKAWKVRLAA
jgi:hypothetical protein